jgi:hypothetical protein
VLFYVPPELLPNKHEDVNQLKGPYEQQMEQLDYEIDQIERMQEIEQRLKGENGSCAMTRTQAAQVAAEADKEVEGAVGLLDGQIDEITDKIEITDMCAAGLHKPKTNGLRLVPPLGKLKLLISVVASF